MIKKSFLLVVLASLLYACSSSTEVAPTIDMDAIHTAAAETVIAEFTQTAGAVPPTSVSTATEALTATPLATPSPTNTMVFYSKNIVLKL